MQEAEAYAEDSVKKARERADAIVSEAKERAVDIALSHSEKAEKEAMAQEILDHALQIVNSENTFSKNLCRTGV